MADNRRSQTRHDVSIAATLIIDAASGDCTISNISLGGALISATDKLAMGKRVRISFKVPTIEDRIEVGATVRWSDGNGVGLQFDGLRARDVWALNEYFKQLPS